jgi:hypothetical protein
MSQASIIQPFETKIPRDSVLPVQKILGCVLDDRSSIPWKGKNSSLRHSVQTGAWVHPDPYPMSIGDSFF